MAQEMEKLPHKLTLDNRQKLTMQGVTQVMGFDDTQVLVATSQGNLLIQGENLQLKALSPEGGQIVVDGHICAFSYEEPKPAGGVLRRLFR